MMHEQVSAEVKTCEMRYRNLSTPHFLPMATEAATEKNSWKKLFLNFTNIVADKL